MTDPVSTDEQSFDHDLARLEQIRRAHKSARPTRENPAWANTHADCSFLLSFIDKLWNEYSRAMNASGAQNLLEALVRAADELEQYVDLQQKLGYIEYAARSQQELDAVNATIASARPQ